MLGCRQVVKASGFDPDIGGSNPPTPANIILKRLDRRIRKCYNSCIKWKIGRVVECTGLENQQGVKPFEGSNPSSSAIYIIH